MLDIEILEKLVYFTDEEIDNLNGKNTIDKSIYTSKQSSIIDYEKLIFTDQQISVRKHARFCEYPKHRHNYIELMYVYGGEMTHIIDDKEIRLCEGDLLLLNQNIEHAIKYTNENDIIFNFIIKPEFLEFFSTMIDKNSYVSSFIFDALYSYDNIGEYLVFKTQNNDLIRNYIEAIITNIYEPKLNNHLELKLLVGILLAELMDHPESIEAYSVNTCEKLVMSSILKYIAISYQEGSLGQLSEEINIPDYKICKILKKTVGKTFKQLIQDERLKVCTKLLLTTDLSVTDIMYEVGYENITYFYNIFKKAYGMTPHEYRIQNAK